MRKGEVTRATVLERAAELARSIGLEGLTIGKLAEELELSKSGLFAHFGSKEALQIAVIEETRRMFVERVFMPALRQPRGEPRVRALFEQWLEWGARRGGCLIVAAASEMDDREGPVRDRVAASHRDWLDTIAQAARIAVGEGHFRAELDVEQFAFEMQALALEYHMVARLLRDPRALERAQRAFESLLERSRALRQ